MWSQQTRLLVAANYHKLMDTAKKTMLMLQIRSQRRRRYPYPGNTRQVRLEPTNLKKSWAYSNGTTNYILTMMTKEGLDYDTALKDAQAQGFAEADPTADVEGYRCCQQADHPHGSHVRQVRRSKRYPDNRHYTDHEGKDRGGQIQRLQDQS